MNKQQWRKAPMTYNYCRICGHRPTKTDEPNHTVRFWDADDGWIIGALCVWCIEDYGDAKPKPGDYAYEKAQQVGEVETDDDPTACIGEAATGYATDLEYYDALKKMNRDEMAQLWREIAEDEFWYLLECVPPLKFTGEAFICGEALTHSLVNLGPIHEAGISLGGRYFSRPIHVLYFSVTQYLKEIRDKFPDLPADGWQVSDGTLQDCYTIMNDEIDGANRTLDSALRDVTVAREIDDPELRKQAQLRGLRAIKTLSRYGHIKPQLVEQVDRWLTQIQKGSQSC